MRNGWTGMKIDSKVISRNAEENVSRRSKNIRKKNKRYLQESAKPFSSWYNRVIRSRLLRYILQTVSLSLRLITDAPSPAHGAQRDQKERAVERLLEDSPKYVALKDLFLSRDKDVKPDLTNCERPHESFYDFGLAMDHRYLSLLM